MPPPTLRSRVRRSFSSPRVSICLRSASSRDNSANAQDPSVPRTLLLLLDNCEHLVEACAQLASALLRTCPNPRLLATSREPLNIDGETVWRIPSLALPEATRTPTLDAVLASEAARLFIE